MFFIGPRSIFCSQWYPLYQTWDGSVLPMGFKVRVDSSSPALFCHLCIMFPRVISGWLDQESNPDHSLLRRTWYHCACLTRLMTEIKVQNITFWYLRLINFVSVLKPCWSKVNITWRWGFNSRIIDHSDLPVLPPPLFLYHLCLLLVQVQ